MRLLLAEDEEAMAEAVVDYLEYHHYEVDWANNGIDALERARMGAYDVLILDIMMPGMDGLTVLRTLRGEGDTTPVLLLTAKGEIRDKVQGFESGSDDYLTKPFAMEELRVRVDALTRRGGQNYQGEQVTFEDLALDKNGYAIRCGDKTVSLSHREYHLIELFIRNPHIYFSADTLLDRVWGMDADVEYGTVWVHISGLRKKLESLGSRAEIRSKRGVGYALEVIE
ncbi:MAG: response regulator transcription factor [Clostridia bacterium]|nr:response regulator transcription factor [Clostridia bacterium]